MNELTQTTIDELRVPRTASPAARLLAEYLLHAPSFDATTSSPKPIPVPERWKGRFKVILSCTNIEEFGLPSFITSYDAKPVLIRNTGTMFRTRGTCLGSTETIDVIEMDINVHKFASVPKKALQTMLNRSAVSSLYSSMFILMLMLMIMLMHYVCQLRRQVSLMSNMMLRFDRMYINVGFCAESRHDDEMPETIFGCATLNRPVYARAPTFN